MQLLKDLTVNFLNLANAMSLYILFGLLLAGLLKELLPKDFITKHLGKSSIGSVIKATLLGIPMPVCSCSVIPLAKSLQKEGASPGAVQSFLISTPITGVDSILATYSFFGWIFALFRVATSIVIAISAGILQNILYKEPKLRVNLSPKVANLNSKNITFASSSCNSSCCNTTAKKDSFSIKRVFTYAFNTLFSDIAKSLFIGLVVGALFTTFLPKELLNQVSQNLILSYLLVIAISMPLYVCATSSLPIGAALLLSGMSVGSVFLFLSAGPATNSVTMSVVKSMYGKKAMAIYIGVIAIMSMFFAYLLDSFYPSLEVANSISHNQGYGAINYVSTAIMLLLMLYYWRKK
jgi:uncharacterized membrane protein YraQ (UPF0718 family)